jgi:hypothetical protein
MTIEKEYHYQKIECDCTCHADPGELRPGVICPECGCEIQAKHEKAGSTAHIDPARVEVLGSKLHDLDTALGRMEGKSLESLADSMFDLVALPAYRKPVIAYAKWLAQYPMTRHKIDTMPKSFDLRRKEEMETYSQLFEDRRNLIENRTGENKEYHARAMISGSPPCQRKKREPASFPKKEKRPVRPLTRGEHERRERAKKNDRKLALLVAFAFTQGAIFYLMYLSFTHGGLFATSIGIGP